MDVNRANIDCDVIGPLLMRLKKLSLDQCTFVRHNENTSLMSCCEVNPFSKLIELNLDFAPSTIAFDAFRKILSLSPQLLRLSIDSVVNDYHIEAIVRYTKNLQVLSMQNPLEDRWHSTLANRNEVFLQLSQLKHLKKLDYRNCGNKVKLAAPLLEAFARATVDFEDLCLSRFVIDANAIKSVSNFKALKYLLLGIIEDVSDDDLLCLIKNLPLLTYLWLNFDSNFRPTSAKLLIKMVKAAKPVA